MLFIIFGWPRRTKEYGPTYPAECPHCNNDNYFHLLKSRRWFSLYFLPLVPLGFVSYGLICPICNAGVELDGRAEAKQAKHLATATDEYHNDVLPVGEYKHELQAFEADVFPDSGGIIPEDIQRQPLENESSRLLRPLLALLFAFALMTTTLGAVNLNPGAVLFGLLFTLPYLAVRYRDSDSTTVPLAGVLKKVN